MKVLKTKDDTYVLKVLVFEVPDTTLTLCRAQLLSQAHRTHIFKYEIRLSCTKVTNTMGDSLW